MEVAWFGKCSEKLISLISSSGSGKSTETDILVGVTELGRGDY